MKVIIFPRLGTDSKRAFLRTRWKFGRTYEYSPKMQLLTRLRKETGMTNEQLLDQIAKERGFLLKFLSGG